MCCSPDVKAVAKRVNEIAGIKESDTGLAPPSRWDLVSDKQAMHEDQPLQVRDLGTSLSWHVDALQLLLLSRASNALSCYSYWQRL